MATLLAWLSTFLTEFGTALIKQAATGQLSAPHTAEIAQANPDVQAAGEAALKAYQEANP